jgi:hypothetical protein
MHNLRGSFTHGTPGRWVLSATLEAHNYVVCAGIITTMNSILGIELYLEEI